MHSAADSAVTAGKSSLPDVSVETQIIILEKLCWGQIRFSVGSEEKISTKRKRETEENGGRYDLSPSGISSGEVVDWPQSGLYRH